MASGCAWVKWLRWVRYTTWIRLLDGWVDQMAQVVPMAALAHNDCRCEVASRGHLCQMGT